MTDLTTPAEAEATADNTSTAHAIGKAATGAWIVDGVDIAGLYAALDETQLDAFRHATTSGLTVTIAAGEAYVSGWLCRDRTTDVDLPADATTTVYVGYDASAVIDASVEAPSDNDNIIVGLAGDFADEDPRTELYTFTTDASTVTGTTDHRKLTQPITFDPVDDAIDLDAPTVRREGTPLATEAEAVAAVESENPLDLVGNLNVADTVDARSLETQFIFHRRNSGGLRVDVGGTNDDRVALIPWNDTDGWLWGHEITFIQDGRTWAIESDVNIDGTLEFNGGAEAAVREGDGVHRDIYVSDTEPSDWSDGDIWMEPQ